MRNIVSADPFGFFPPLGLEAIARAIRLCGRILAINRGKSLHSYLVKLGIGLQTYISNNLIAMYTDFGCYNDARKKFDEMPERNVVSWTALISAHTRSGNPSKALAVFTQMLKSNLEEPNRYTFSAALKACALAGDLELGRWIHERVLQVQLQCDTVLMNAILDMYIKCGSLCEARRVFDGFFMTNTASWNTIISGYCGEGNMDGAEYLFDRISQPDVVSYNTMIAGFAQIESPKALDYVSTMHRKGFMLDSFTFPCALKTCGIFGFEKMGKQIHSYIIRCGLELNCFTGSSLIDMYANCGIINDAMKLYYWYLSCKELVCERLALMNSMLSGYSINRYDNFALDLIMEIWSFGVKFDAFTLSSTLKVCINLENIRLGHQIHSIIIKDGFDMDYVVGTVLLDLYARCGNLEDVFRLFDGLAYKDVIAWTGLIASCVKKGSNHLAFSIFKQMIGVEVDHYVVSNILKACSSLAWFQGGVQIHAYTIKNGLNSESITIFSLIDMYSKCGHIEDGLKIFESAPEKDTICWTGMIVGCGYNGKSKEAVELFEKMLKYGIRPSEITFLGVLSACRNGGLVVEACEIFKKMGNEYGLRPALDHYCCMVDILSRAGKLQEAKKLISDMPYEPNENIRNSLIGASVVSQNSDFGLFSVDFLPIPTQDKGGYITMSNAFASMGFWDVSCNLREIIRKEGAKEAGRSWVTG